MRIIFAGTPDFAASHLEFLLQQNDFSFVGVFTQPDRPSGRGRKSYPSPVKRIAEKNHIRVFQPKSFGDVTSVKMVQELQADLMVVVAYGLILPNSVLTMPRFGCINVHASLLPRWRGAAPVQRCIEAGDSETGISIMQMNEGLDTGDILATSRCKIGSDDDTESISKRLIGLSGPALLGSVRLIAQGRSIQIPQNNSLSCYAAKIQKYEARINWSSHSAIIQRKIRAFSPKPGAYSMLDGKRIKIYTSDALEKRSTRPPGTIINNSQIGLEVSCGFGTIVLNQIQLEGKSSMQFDEVFKSNADLFRLGQRFE